MIKLNPQIKYTILITDACTIYLVKKITIWKHYPPPPKKNYHNSTLNGPISYSENCVSFRTIFLKGFKPVASGWSACERIKIRHIFVFQTEFPCPAIVALKITPASELLLKKSPTNVRVNDPSTVNYSLAHSWNA